MPHALIQKKNIVPGGVLINTHMVFKNKKTTHNQALRDEENPFSPSLLSNPEGQEYVKTNSPVLSAPPPTP